MSVIFNKQCQTDIAREMAETFIQRLNQPPQERHPYKVTLADKITVRVALNGKNSSGLSNLEDLVQHFSWPSPALADDNPFFVLGEGSHNYVLGHKALNSVVIKLMRKEDAEIQRDAAKKANDLAIENNFAFCNFPDSTTVDLDHPKYSSAYIESRLPLKMGMYAHYEFWARIISHYHSDQSTPLFKENLLKMVQEIEAFVLKVKFWDIGTKNCPEVGTDGVAYALDFENVNEENCGEGLRRVVELLPLDEVADLLRPSHLNTLAVTNACITLRNQRWIDSNRPAYCSTLETEESLTRHFERSFEKGKIESEALMQALQFYDQKGWGTGLENQISYDDQWEADLLSTQPEDLQAPMREIIKALRQSLRNNSYHSETEAISIRRHANLSVPNCTGVHKQLLEYLKSEGIIASYSATEFCGTKYYTFYF